MLAGGTLSAQLLTEDFNYTTGQFLNVNGWSAHSGTGTGPIAVSAAGLTYTDYAGSAIGNAADVFGSGEDVNRGFTEQYKDGSTIYLSALLNVTEAANSLTGGYFLHLGDRVSGTSFTTFAARVFAKVDASGNVNFGFANTSTVTYSATNFAKNTTYLLVVKYKINKSGVDTTSLWIIPSGVPANEAAAGAPLLTDNTLNGADIIDAIGLRQASNIPDVVVDGIRIGTTWDASVLGGTEPIIEWSKKSIAFGQVYVGSSVIDTVIVTNTGLTTLNISAVSSTDAVVTVSPSNAVINAAASQEFIVTYTPTGAATLSGGIAFTSDATSSPDTITFAGEALPFVPIADFTPLSIDFGKVNVGSSVSDTITVVNSGVDTLKISSVTSGVVDYVVVPTDGMVLPGDSLKFGVTFTPSTAEVFATSITFNHNAEVPVTKVAVTGQGVEAGFTASTLFIDFGNVWKDSVATDSVIVSNSSTTLQLVIDSVKSTNELFTVTPTSGSIDTSSAATFVVTFAPTAKGPQVGEVIFYSNAPSMIDTVAVSGFGAIPEPVFAVMPATINYSGVLVGTSKMDSVMVTNMGTDTLNISGVTSSNAQFVVTPTSATLDTMASQMFYITFSPTSAGPQSAAIVFASNTEAGFDTVGVFGSSIPTVTIAEARKDVNADLKPDYSISKDTLVIYGIVTSGNFQSSGTSYFIQDATAGINVFSFDPAETQYVIGDSVMVIGKVAQFRGLTEFTPLAATDVYFKILKHDAIVPSPKWLYAHDFTTNVETYEGSLIKLDTLYKISGTWPASQSNASIFMTNAAGTDTIQFFIDFDSNIGGSTEPIYPINVIGVVSQYSSGSSVFNNGYEIVPRSTDDFVHTPGIAGVRDAFAGIPDNFELYNNYPNPFNPSTMIRFALPNAATAKLVVYDMLGREVRTLLNGNFDAGYHQIAWNGRNNEGVSVSTGMYLYRIEAGSFVSTKKMLLMK